jgi:hypothetical protein
MDWKDLLNEWIAIIYEIMTMDSGDYLWTYYSSRR